MMMVTLTILMKQPFTPGSNKARKGHFKEPPASLTKRIHTGIVTKKKDNV